MIATVIALTVGATVWVVSQTASKDDVKEMKETLRRLEESSRKTSDSVIRLETQMPFVIRASAQAQAPAPTPTRMPTSGPPPSGP